MRTLARVTFLAAMLASLSSVASAYYHWIYFADRTGPFQPIRAKFDLTALPDKTVSYFISDQPPSTLMPKDSFDALVSQIRLAAETWNGVSTSDLRLRFGGLSKVGTTQATAGIDVVFDDDMSPGLLALTKPSLPEDVGDLSKGPGFVPLLRSRLQFRSDLTVFQQASFTDAFFMTMIHEFGHTVGLQHSTTSATMSTAPTRSTSKARPLSADDIAGISLLYPKAGFPASTGSISGRITAAGNGVSLASVVALSKSGVAIGGMTNPDGTYRIDGIPPGDYYVYAHPLPPAQLGEDSPAAIIPASDSHGVAFPIDTGFDTRFFPNTRDWTQATVIAVKAAASADDINLNLGSRPGAKIYNMRFFGYFGPSGKEVAVHAPPLVSGDRRYLVFDGAGLLAGNTTQLAPGLHLSVIGESAAFEQPSLAYYTDGFLKVITDTNSVSSATPVALAVTTNDDLYVLPAAFSVVPTAPPVISSITGDTNASGDAHVTIAGANLSAATRILFDGASASTIQLNEDGTLTVSAPPATGTHAAAVEALASDGQTSSQALASTAVPPTFTYSAPDKVEMTVNPATVTAGTDTMIEVTGFNTTFLDGQTVIGFGSSDITVGRVWVVDRTHLLLNISVSPAAASGPAIVTVATGLQLVTLSTVLQVRPPSLEQVSLRAPVVNLEGGLAGVPMGGIALIGASGLPATNLAYWKLTVGGINKPFNVTKDNQLRVQVPYGIPFGPAAVQLIPPTGDYIPPILMQVDSPPPVIMDVQGPDGRDIDSSSPVVPGDTITLTVAGLTDPWVDPLAPVPQQTIHVVIGGVEQILSSVTMTDQPGLGVVEFVLSGPLPDKLIQSMTVRIETRISESFGIAATSAAPASH